MPNESDPMADTDQINAGAVLLHDGESDAVARAIDDLKTVRSELDRLHILESGLRADLIGQPPGRAQISAATGQLREELSTTRQLLAHTQTRFDAERFARARDRRAWLGVETRAEELVVALAACEHDRNRVAGELSVVLDELAALRNTWSWRVTAPLRRARGFNRSLRGRSARSGEGLSR